MLIVIVNGREEMGAWRADWRGAAESALLPHPAADRSERRALVLKNMIEAMVCYFPVISAY